MSDQEWPSAPGGGGSQPPGDSGQGSQPPGGSPPPGGGGSQPPSSPPPSGPPPAGGGGAAAAGGQNDPRTGLPYADFGKRAMAVLIDFGVFLAIYIVIFILALILGAISDVLGFLFTMLAWLAVLAFSLAYFIGGEGGPLAQTFGKHMMGIRVVGPTTEPLGYGKAAIRYVGRILDTIVCGLPIGYLWPLWDAENRCWHDMVADTRVVVAPTSEKSFNYWMNNVRG